MFRRDPLPPWFAVLFLAVFAPLAGVGLATLIATLLDWMGAR
jgi:hypothetical protein